MITWRFNKQNKEEVMFLKKEKLIGSLSFNQSEFEEKGQRKFLFQDFDDERERSENKILKTFYPDEDKDLDGIPNIDDNNAVRKATSEELKSYTDLKKAEIDSDTEIKVAEINRETTRDVKQFDKEIAEIKARAEISVAREITDPNEISIDEFKAIDVITRNNLAGEGLEEFTEAVENKTPDAIKDLQTLQKALKADGKYNGKIDEDFGVGTKTGMNALISENAPAIKSYYETKQLLQENSTKQVSPKDTPVEKEIDTELEK